MKQVKPQKPSAPFNGVMLLGDYPLQDEVEQGRPFIGPAGKTLNIMLRTAGLDRNAFYLTNVFNERLPGDEIANILAPQDEAKKGGYAEYPYGNAGYLRPEWYHHLTRLQKEIESVVGLNVIVPLGPIALWSLTGNSQLASYRGSVNSSTRLGGSRKLVPTFHPDAVRKQWKYFPVVVDDIARAVKEAKRGPEIILPKRVLYLEPNLQDFKGYLPKLLGSDLLSVDIETGWGQMLSIGFAPSAEEALVVPFVDLRQPNRSYWLTTEEEVEALLLTKAVLESDVPKLGQNYAGYDFYWLYERYGIGTRNLLHDTRLMHHAIYPELEKSLGFMSGSYSEQGAWKTWGRHGEKRDD